MKKLLIITLVLSAFLSACKKEEDSPVSTSGFTARIDGEFWRSASTQISIAQGGIVITGESSDGSKMTINLDGDTAGTYILDENSGSGASYVLRTGGQAFNTGANASAGGTLIVENISSKDKKITASFQFDVVRPADQSSIGITEGKIKSVSYTTTAAGTVNNSLSVKIGNTNWTPQNINAFLAFKTINLTATDADGTRSLVLEFPDLTAPGSYELNYFTNYKAVFTNSAGKKHYAISGTLEVISHNLIKREIEATFNVILEAHEGGGKVSLTEGSFLVVYN